MLRGRQGIFLLVVYYSSIILLYDYFKPYEVFKINLGLQYLNVIINYLHSGTLTKPKYFLVLSNNVCLFFTYTPTETFIFSLLKVVIKRQN